MSHIEKSAPSRVVVVLGMHRSGTSALAGTLSQIGLSPGSEAELMPATVDANPKGYFEHVSVVRAHDRLLGAFGMEWSDPRPLPDGWLRHPSTLDVKVELKALLSILLARHGTVVVKDPRLCRFVPMWRELLSEMGVPVYFAFIVRHPAEVAASLRRRDDISEYLSGLLSLAYQLEAEAATRGACRLFLTYEDLIQDWRGQLNRCREEFGSDVIPLLFSDAAVEGFLDAQLRNHSSASVYRLDPDVVAAYGCFVSAVREPDDLPAALDNIRSRFEAARRAYAAATEAVLSALALDRERQSAPDWSRGLELASAWNAPVVDVGPSAPPRLYGRTTAGVYSEKSAVDGVIDFRPGGIIVAKMILPANFPLERIRFDPDSAPGAYELIEINLDGSTVDDIAGRVAIVSEQRMLIPGANTFAWAAAGQDPWVELDLHDRLGSSSESCDTRIEFKYRRLTASRLLDEASAERHARQLQSLVSIAGAVGEVRADVIELSASAAVSHKGYADQSALLQSTLDGHSSQLSQLAEHLASMSESLSELKCRSDRPFWHRYRRWQEGRLTRDRWRSVGWEMLLEPLANVELSAERKWQGSNCDPQFILRPNSQVREHMGAPLQPGWYVIAISGYAYSGTLDNPCLYPDYGRGASGGERIVLLPYNTQGESETVVFLNKGLRSLRFDPTDEDAVFDIKVTLRPVSRVVAWLHMLCRTLRQEHVTTADRLRKIAGLIFSGVRSGSVGPRARVMSDYRALQSSVTNDYFKWMRRTELACTPIELDARLSKLHRKPLLSIVMPVYEAPERWLRRALESVIGQHYPHWELCVADDSSTSPHVREVLEEYLEREKRIKVIYRENNGHISACSNSALGLACGEYAVLLDQDDELHPEALLLVAEAICNHPDAMLIYSDEDKIDERGVRFDPYFKPDWNYDLLLGQNFVSHLGVYSLKVLRDIGGFRVGLEGSQDWDLALRFIERIAPSQILHIPRVLYHWRAIEGSTALAADEKSYAVQAGSRAVKEHLDRIGVVANVEILPQSMLRVKREVEGPEPLVTLIIPTRDRVDLLRMCVESIVGITSYKNYEILIVDNDSSEPGTFDFFKDVESLGFVRVIKFGGDFNYSAINNFAVNSARGSIVGLINNDIEVKDGGWLNEMVSHALRPDVGAVGAMLYYPDDTIQHAGVLVGLCGVAGHIGSRYPRGSHGYFGRMLLTQELSAVTAACLIVRKSVFLQVGGLDERLRVAFNDVDFCLRLRSAGYRNIWTPVAELYHHESASRGLEDNPEKALRFLSEVNFMKENWGEVLECDPAYNPNLSMTSQFCMDY